MSTWKMKIRLSFDEIIPFQWCHICYWGLPKCALWSHNLIRWFYGYVFDLVFAQCTCCIFTNIYVLPKRGEYILGIAFSRQFHPLYRRLYKRAPPFVEYQTQIYFSTGGTIGTTLWSQLLCTFWFRHQHISIVPTQGSLVHKDQILLLT